LKNNITLEESKWIGNLLGADWIKFTPEQFRLGLDAELEQGIISMAGIVSSKDLIITGKIALANLNAQADYYSLPEKTDNKIIISPGPGHVSYSVDASIDSIVDSPFTETYQSDYKENRREHRNFLQYE